MTDSVLILRLPYLLAAISLPNGSATCSIDIATGRNLHWWNPAKLHRFYWILRPHFLDKRFTFRSRILTQSDGGLADWYAVPPILVPPFHPDRRVALVRVKSIISLRREGSISLFGLTYTAIIANHKFSLIPNTFRFFIQMVAQTLGYNSQ